MKEMEDELGKENEELQSQLDEAVAKSKQLEAKVAAAEKDAKGFKLNLIKPQHNLRALEAALKSQEALTQAVTKSVDNVNDSLKKELAAAHEALQKKNEPSQPTRQRIRKDAH